LLRPPKRDSVWQRPFVEQARARVCQELGACAARLGDDQTLALARDRYDQLSRGERLEEQLDGILYGLEALRLGGSSEAFSFGDASRIYERVSALLARHRVRPRSSRISFLHSELHAHMAQACSRAGEHVRSAWELRLAVRSGLAAADAVADSDVSLALKEAAIGSLLDEVLPAPSGEDRSLHQLRLVQARLFRLTHDLESAHTILQTLSGLAAVWERAAVAAQQSGDCAPLAALVRRHRQLRTPRRHLMIYLWSRAQRSRACEDAVPRPSSVRRRAREAIDPALLHCALAIENSCEMRASIAERMERLGRVLPEFSHVGDFECQLLLWACAGRWLLRCKQAEFAEFAFTQYRHLSLALATHPDLFHFFGRPPPAQTDLPATGLARRSLILSHMTAQLLVARSRRNEDREERVCAYAEILSRFMGSLKGPVMKIGQLLSHYGVELPPDARDALGRLQDAAPHISASHVRATVEAELGAPADRLFSEFCPEPMATGSIGQVHRARLLDGTNVAVKVQYPQIERIIHNDLRTLGVARPLLRRLFPRWEIDALLRELADRLCEECDYRREAANQQRFGAMFAGHPSISVPRVFAPFCSQRVLCTEYVQGSSLESFRLSATPEQRRVAGDAVMRFVTQSMFWHYAFNTDVHPGNLLFTGDRVHFIDYGNVCYWDSHDWGWAGIVKAMLEGDVHLLRRAFLALGLVRANDEFDFEWVYSEFAKRLLRCSRHEGPMRFVQQDLTADLELMVMNHPCARNFTLPARYLYGFRAYWGLAATLIGLEAEVEWRQLLADVVRRSPTPIPPVDEPA
jgi:hypothetical protein